MEGTVGLRLTNGELAVKPEPGKSGALHPPSFSTSVIVDVMKDATSNDSDGHGGRQDQRPSSERTSYVC
jgi:hypothetical protein